MPSLLITRPLPDEPANVSPCRGEIAELCEQALKEGHTPAEIIVEGLSSGMTKCGKKYGMRGMYLDTILWSMTAFQMGLASLSSASQEEPLHTAGKVVLAVMDGPWTIGKAIVSRIRHRPEQ